MTGLLREQLGVILKITPVVSAMILLMNSASWEYWEYFSSRVRTRGREEPALRGWFCDVFSRAYARKNTPNTPMIVFMRCFSMIWVRE